MQQAFPLSEDERDALMKLLVLDEMVFIVCGAFVAMCVSCMRSLDAAWAILAFGWVEDLTRHMSVEPVVVGVGVAFALVLNVLESPLYKRSEICRAATDEVRQGISGELIRLPLAFIVAIMCVVGIAEELLFRYGAIEFLLVLPGAFVPDAAARVLALIVSTGLFTAVHLQYKNPVNIATVSVLGLVLGIAYLLTESLLSIMIAHALYDMITLVAERRRMQADPDFFKGKPPERLVLEMKQAQQS